MKRLLISYLILFLFYACNIKDHAADIVGKTKISKYNHGVISIYDSDVQRITEDSIVSYSDKEKEVYSFKFLVHESNNILKKIKVYRNNKLIQTIEANKRITTSKYEFIDWNFDGYNDISVITDCGSGGCTYLIWNYNIKDKMFHYNSELSEILGLEIDRIFKEIIIHYRFGWTEEYWHYYKYLNDTLSFQRGILMEVFSDDEEINWQRWTFQKMINNVLTTETYINRIKMSE